MNSSLDRKAIPQALVRDCLCLLVSLVLTEAKVTPPQRREISRLIKKLKPHAEVKL